MKTLNIRAALGMILVGLAFAGCNSDGGNKQAVRPSKPAGDPSAWNTPTMSKSSDDGTSVAAGTLPGTSSFRGTTSSEGAEIERSLGVSR